MAWRPVSFWGSFQHVSPNVHPLNHLQWQQQQQQQEQQEQPHSPMCGVFEQKLSGEELRGDRSHISIAGTALLPDASIPELLSTAQASASTDTRFLAVDALYSLEPVLCEQLNSFLEDSAFGPFPYVSDAVFSLLQLRRKRSSEAESLEEKLAAFAEQHQGSLQGMLQWPQLLKMKKERDVAAHPFSAPLLPEQLANGNADLEPVRGALEVLLSVA